MRLSDTNVKINMHGMVKKCKHKPKQTNKKIQNKNLKGNWKYI